MTDGLANEIEFSFERDARTSEKNRLAGCKIGSVLLSKALAVTQSAGPVAVRVGAKSMPNPGETGAPNAPALAVNFRAPKLALALLRLLRARVEPSSLPSAAVTQTRCSAENARSIFILGLSNRHRRELFSSVALAVTRCAGSFLALSSHRHDVRQKTSAWHRHCSVWASFRKFE